MRNGLWVLALLSMAGVQPAHAAAEIGLRFDATVDTLGDHDSGLATRWRWGGEGEVYFQSNLYRLKNDPTSTAPVRETFAYKQDSDRGHGAGVNVPSDFLGENPPVYGHTYASINRLTTQLSFTGQPAGAQVLDWWRNEFVLAGGESATYGGLVRFDVRGDGFAWLGTPAVAGDEAPVSLGREFATSAQAGLRLGGDDGEVLLAGIAVGTDSAAAVITRQLDPGSGWLTLTIFNPTDAPITGMFSSGTSLHLDLASPVPEPTVHGALLVGLLLLGVRRWMDATRVQRVGRCRLLG